MKEFPAGLCEYLKSFGWYIVKEYQKPHLQREEAYHGGP